MIKINNKAVQKAQINGKEVLKIMVGTNKVYEKITAQWHTLFDSSIYAKWTGLTFSSSGGTFSDISGSVDGNTVLSGKGKKAFICDVNTKTPQLFRITFSFSNDGGTSGSFNTVRYLINGGSYSSTIPTSPNEFTYNTEPMLSIRRRWTGQSGNSNIYVTLKKDGSSLYLYAYLNGGSANVTDYPSNKNAQLTITKIEQYY